MKETHDALVQSDSTDWLIDDLGDSRPSRPTKRFCKGEYLGGQLRNQGEASSSMTITRPRRTISSSSSSDSEVC